MSSAPTGSHTLSDPVLALTATLRAGTAGPRAWPALTPCGERSLGLSPGLLGSEAPAAPSMRWGGRNRPGRTFPGSLSASRRGDLPLGIGGERAHCSSLAGKPSFPTEEPQGRGLGNTQGPPSGQRETRGLGTARGPDRRALGQVQRRKARDGRRKGRHSVWLSRGSKSVQDLTVRLPGPFPSQTSCGLNSAKQLPEHPAS